MRYTRYIIYLIVFLISENYIPASAQLQSDDLVSKFYPNPDIGINTPGLSKTKGFMNYDDLIAFLNIRADKQSDMMKIQYAGESVLGKKIPIVFLANESNNPKVKIWMQGGLHGNEPAGTECLLMFIDDLLKANNIDSILDFVSFAIVPMANIDGYEKQVRENENNKDLNRDQVLLVEKESVYLKKAFTDFSPSVAIDFHEYKPFRKELDNFSTEKLCIAEDVLFLPSGNLNIPSKLRDLTNQLYLSNIKEVLDRNKITYDNYFVPNTNNGINFLQMGGNSPRSSSTSYGLTNSVSILIEIRGVKLDKTSYKRRVFSGFLIAKSILETTLENRKIVSNTISSSIKETIERKNPIVIDAKPFIYTENKSFININKLEHQILKLEILDEGRSQAVSMRKRPKAYLLLAKDEHIIKKLQILGLEIDTLKTDLKINAEVFKLNTKKVNQETEADSSIYISVQNKVFPKGSFVISTAQKNANIAVSTLEPEMENGYFRYKMIKENSEGEIPIYRLLKDIKTVKKKK